MFLQVAHTLSPMEPDAPEGVSRGGRVRWINRSSTAESGSLFSSPLPRGLVDSRSWNGVHDAGALEAATRQRASVETRAEKTAGALAIWH
ncbi:hypothetical protein CDD83_11205 [Cordyceps sp. RAO-2017]|nr:hypothetical protein CDD83_11205 [Cordyceps sp. RAO-2017]